MPTNTIQVYRYKFRYRAGRGRDHGSEDEEEEEECSTPRYHDDEYGGGGGGDHDDNELMDDGRDYMGDHDKDGDDNERSTPTIIIAPPALRTAIGIWPACFASGKSFDKNFLHCFCQNDKV